MNTALALQVNGVAPYGAFHDLRWLAVYGSSWWSVALSLVALVVGRGTVTALSVRWAWPEEVDFRGFAHHLRRGMGATILAVVLLAPSTTLLFALAVVPLSWLFIAAVPAAIVVALIVCPVAVRGGWWRRSIPWSGLVWVGGSFLVFSIGSVVLGQAPRWAVLPMAAAAGLFNARAWEGLVHAVVVRRPGAGIRMAPVVPVALAALVAGVVVGSTLGFSHARPHPTPATLVRPGSAARGHIGDQPVLVIDGYGSTWNGMPAHPIPGPFFEQRFSYRGLSGSGVPLAYAGSATVQSLDALTASLAMQVDALHRATGRRIDLVAESEGALVAETYLHSKRALPVATVILASPLLDPGRATYPVGGAGEGVAARVALQVLS
ncbi:MAG: hypothetical protein ACRDY1_05855, partial [Acidimicrobiales bacterium]